MKQLLLIPILLFAFRAAQAQAPEPCQGDMLFPADNCDGTCLFNCYINGFTGNTGGFTPDTTINFCGTIETSQWFAFTASTVKTTFTATPSFCINGDGIQIAVYSDCSGSTLLPNGCDGGGNGNGDIPVTVTVDLVHGEIYYLMIDGFAGDLCDFVLEVTPPEAVSSSVLVQTTELCAYETVSIHGQEYTAPDTVTIITPAASGCDSVEIYYLQIRETVEIGETLTFCPGESFTLNGVVYNQETVITDTIGNPSGCDTIRTYTLKYSLDPGDCPSCSETFIKTIGVSGQNMRGYGVYEAGDGNLYVTGSRQDSALLMKIYPGGNIIWSRTFDLVPGVPDNIADILEDSDGMIAGCGQGGDVQPGLTGFAFRYDPANDQMLWVQTFSEESPYVMGILEKNPGGNYIIYSNPHEPVNNAGLTEISRLDGSYSISPMSKLLDLGAADNFNSALIQDGSMYGVGRFTNGGAFTDMRHVLARIDVSNGDITFATLNHVPAGDPARLYGMDLVMENTPAYKGIYSVSFGDESGENLNNSHIFLHKTANSGNLLWTKRIDLEEITSESVDEIVSVPDGFILYARNLAAPPGDLYLVKTDKSGNLMWSKKVDVGFDDNYPQVSTAQSQILVKGDYLYFTATTTDQSGHSRMILAKTTLDATVDGDCDFIKNTPANLTDVLNPKTWAVSLTDMLPDPSFLPVSATTHSVSLAADNLCKVFVNQAVDVNLCPGESILIGGVNYQGPGAAIDTVAGNAGCDTIRNFTIHLLPQPERHETVLFCEGDSVVIGGNTYMQPGVVFDTVPAATGCDTIITYTLQFSTSPNASLSIDCPDNIDIPTTPGTGSVAVDYDLPLVSGDCDCPGISLDLLQGASPGALFPVGVTQVCYEARDSCGNTATCCFLVTIREESACDIKQTACIKYELLGITKEADGDLRYKIRVTNHCANKLIYTAMEISDGITATAPADNSVFSAQSGRKYDVRNPNYSPFHSVRFKSQADSIANGQSDVFEYAIPGQTPPDYIHVTARLYPQVFYEAYLNTFYCPVLPDNDPSPGARSAPGTRETGTHPLKIFPNPTGGRLFADLSGWKGSLVSIRIYNNLGQRVYELQVSAEQELRIIDLPEGLTGGLYRLEAINAGGEKQGAQFVLKAN